VLPKLVLRSLYKLFEAYGSCVAVNGENRIKKDLHLCWNDMMVINDRSFIVG